MKKAFVQITTTTPTEELAREIARLIVVRKLAGCVQVSGPIASFYRWKGKIMEDKEWLCTIKTVHENYDQIAGCITSLHSYEVPEIIVSPIIGGSKAYLDWISSETEFPD